MRFRSRHSQLNHVGSLYGGQVLAQALVAAARLTPGKAPHSAHGYFLRAGSAEAPVDYEVEALRDGRRVATRRVSALQAGKPIFHLHCSFVEPLGGFEHQLALPSGGAAPDALPGLAAYVAAHAERLSKRTVESYGAPFPLELRLIEPEGFFFDLLPEPKRAFWLRMPSAEEIEDPVLHRCLAAFLSDYWIAGVGAGTHVLPTDRTTLQILSLDHAMWFHRPTDFNEWHLYHQESPSASGGRGFNLGSIYRASDGALVASCAQEGLMRVRKPKPKG